MARTVSSGVGEDKYRLLLLTVALGGIVAPLNSTMLAVALPDLRAEFGVGHAEIAWLVSAYLIAMAVAQPLGGRLGDQLGRGRTFRIGLWLFLGLSLAAAAAPGFWALLICRTGQALVGAAVIPNGFAMLRESVPPNKLGRSGGIMGSAMSGAAAIGPLLGAALLGLGSWRFLFLVNVPPVAAGLLAFHALGYVSRRRGERVRLDWIGAAVFATLLVLLTLMLGALKGELPVVLMAGGSVVFIALFALFIRQQSGSAEPIAEWSLFRIRSYAASTGYVLLSNLAMYTTILAVPFFVEEVQGKGSLETGTLLAAMSIPVALTAPVSGRISDDVGRRPPVLAGSILVLVAVTALLVGLAPDMPYWMLAVPLLLMGLGLGLSVGPSGAAAIESTPIELAGTAAGTNSMMRYVGSIIGAGVLGAVLNTDGDAPEVGVFRAVFLVMAVVSAVACVCTLGIHRFAPAPRVEEVYPGSGVPVEAAN
jgi:EmrB/QacA subfamily drug resistance transporter